MSTPTPERKQEETGIPSPLTRSITGSIYCGKKKNSLIQFMHPRDWSNQCHLPKIHMLLYLHPSCFTAKWQNKIYFYKKKNSWCERRTFHLVFKVLLGGRDSSQQSSHLSIQRLVLGYLKMVVLNHGHFRSSPSQTLLWRLCGVKSSTQEASPRKGLYWLVSSSV